MKIYIIFLNPNSVLSWNRAISAIIKLKLLDEDQVTLILSSCFEFNLLKSEFEQSNIDLIFLVGWLMSAWFYDFRKSCSEIHFVNLTFLLKRFVRNHCHFYHFWRQTLLLPLTPYKSLLYCGGMWFHTNWDNAMIFKNLGLLEFSIFYFPYFDIIKIVYLHYGGTSYNFCFIFLLFILLKSLFLLFL